mmetsp:Transcript_44101/g.114705  ORF Transcript_44101/g.114705 Transcript_44101/m.114705 type:complete len:219 (-) Transcript_44101:12-668(-)
MGMRHWIGVTSLSSAVTGTSPRAIANPRHRRARKSQWKSAQAAEAQPMRAVDMLLATTGARRPATSPNHPLAIVPMNIPPNMMVESMPCCRMVSPMSAAMGTVRIDMRHICTPLLKTTAPPVISIMSWALPNPTSSTTSLTVSRRLGTLASMVISSTGGVLITAGGVLVAVRERLLQEPPELWAAMKATQVLMTSSFVWNGRRPGRTRRQWILQLRPS